VKSVAPGRRMQTELFETLQDISRDWFARATSAVELAFKLPRQLNNARSVPDALSAYQECLGEWMSMRGEDGRRSSPTAARSWIPACAASPTLRPQSPAGEWVLGLTIAGSPA
jgi:hypothetical protein